MTTIYRVNMPKYGKSALFVSTCETKAKQQFMKHFKLTSTDMSEITVEKRPIDGNGFLDLSLDYGPNGSFTEEHFINDCDE